VFGQDVELRYLWACSPLFGFPASEIIGKTDAEILSNGQIDELLDVKRRVLASATAARQQVTVRVNGADRRYDIYVEPCKTDGHLMGITGVVTEIEMNDEKS
jgi:hypothetical protein